MGEHYVVRSWMFSMSEMFVVRDVYNRNPFDAAADDDPTVLLRVDWLTPDGWVLGVEGGNPTLYEPWELLPRFAEALGVEGWLR